MRKDQIATKVARAPRNYVFAAGAVVAIAGMVASSARAAAFDYPVAPKRAVSEAFHGTTVVDHYRWLEDDNAPEVKDWVRAQNALTRKYLDSIPQRGEIARRVEKLLAAKTVSRYDFQYRGGKVFAQKDAPPKNQSALVTLPPDLDLAREHVVLDPTVLDPKGRTTIDFYKPSFDGKHVVVSLSENGSEAGTAYVYEVASGKRLTDVIADVTYPTAGGSVEWTADSTGLYYTRYPLPDERPEADRHFYQTVWFHKLGTPHTDDHYVIGHEFPRIAEVALNASRDGKYLLAEVKNGDGGEIAFYLRNPGEQWTQVARHTDGIKHMTIGQDGNLWAMSIKGAPLGQVISIPLAAPALEQAHIVVPATSLAAEQVIVARTRLYVQYQNGGPSTVRMYSLAGKPMGELPAENVANIAVGEVLDGDDVIVGVMSYLSPPTRFVYRAGSQRLQPTRLNDPPRFGYADAAVDRVFVTSKDGTRVPMTILHRKGLALDANTPVILYGYGGYGISMAPYFSRMNRLWLDYGGAFAVANVRGGGEYGEPWHEAGKLTRKQNVFDDFAACMKFLVDRKYTRPERLAIMGGSNGGLLMGAAMTQHPLAMRAVVSEVGIYDSLRWETQPNGEFNVTEFGSVANPDQFKALQAYSPLLRVRDGVGYPAVLLTSGDNDGRVAPYESRKMAARLQAATGSEYPILLRTEAEAGHGIGTALSTQIQEETDIYSFLFDQLGVAGPVGGKSAQK